MENELDEINDKFQNGEYEQAINELQILIDKSIGNDFLYKCYDRLGDYLNFIGQHTEAVESWKNSLKILENNSQGIDQLNEQKFFDWINISLEIARFTHRQGKDGPGVSYKYNTISWSISNSNQDDEEEWKKEKFETSIKYYKQIIENISSIQLETKRKIQIQLAQVLFDAKYFYEAVQIYEDAFNNDGNPEWLYKAAQCSWEQGNKEQAYIRLQQLIDTESDFANAYKMSADYFTEKNDFDNAKECQQKYQFYSWIPNFCHYIEYNKENFSILSIIESDKALEYIQTILTLDTSKKSTEFLASICYHHYHGPIEDKAFEQLEKRGIEFEGEEKYFICSILMELLKNQQSICTIKGVVNALAGIKYNELFEILENLLPEDINFFFPMHIPKAMAKLSDERAIPLLIKIIEEPPVQIENDDSDLANRLILSGGMNRLIVESCLALSPFINDNKVKQLLINGINNEKLCEACLAVLCLSTQEKKYFEKLEKILLAGNTLNYMVIQYLEENKDKSQYANQLINLNKDILMKKNKRKTIMMMIKNLFCFYR